MAEIEVMRAEAEWQRAGAYLVIIEGMNRQHHISLREEVDKHDCDGIRYIVMLDEGYPVAACRFYYGLLGAVHLVFSRGEAECGGFVRKRKERQGRCQFRWRLFYQPGCGAFHQRILQN